MLKNLTGATPGNKARLEVETKVDPQLKVETSLHVEGPAHVDETPKVQAELPALPDEAAQKLVDSRGATAPGFGARPSSSLLAMRIQHKTLDPAHGSEELAAPRVVLRATLKNPDGTRPSFEEVGSKMLELLQQGLFRRQHNGLQAIAAENREGYYAVVYDEKSGALELRQVALGSASEVELKKEQVLSALRPGEVLLGGLHNEPGKEGGAGSDVDQSGHAQTQTWSSSTYRDFAVGIAGVTEITSQPAEHPADQASFAMGRDRHDQAKREVKELARQLGISEQEAGELIHDLKQDGTFDVHERSEPGRDNPDVDLKGMFGLFGKKKR